MRRNRQRGFVLLCSLIFISAAVSGCGGSSTGATPTATLIVLPTSAGPSPSQILNVIGVGSKRTDKFSTGKSWRIHWIYDCRGITAGRAFKIILHRRGTAVATTPVTATAVRGSGVTAEHGTAVYRLEIASPCHWHIRVSG